MKHISTQDISAFLDGKLSLSRMRTTASHIEACEVCRNEYEAWKKTRAMLRRAPKSVTPGADFWAATEARFAEVERSPMQAPAIAFKTARPTFITWMASAAASAAAVVVLVLSISHSPTLFGPMPPGAIAPQSPDTLNNDDVTSFVSAHTEAAAAQPLADGSRQIMLAVDADDPSDPTAGDTTANVDTSL